MAFLDATLWNDLQVTGATNEKRFAELGLLDAVKESTPFTDEYISPAAREAMQSFSASRDMQILKEILEYLKRKPKLVRVLNVKNRDGDTGLHIAVRQGNQTEKDAGGCSRKSYF